MGDIFQRLVDRLKQAHGVNLKSVVLYGSAALDGHAAEEGPKKIVVVLDRLAPSDLKAAHSVAEDWASQGNPFPVYFTLREMEDSSDVFPIEFTDMSRVRRVLYGLDPFDNLEVPTYNLRHQLEYELRGKLLRLRTVYINVAENPDHLARLMADSIHSFSVLARHVLGLFGIEAPYEERDSIMALANHIGLNKAVINRIYEYAADEEVWLGTETNETFAAYLVQIERMIDAVNDH